MKAILLLAILATSATVHAQTLGLAWDPPTDLARITHYRVFATQGTVSNIVAEVPVSVNRAFFPLACAQDYSLTVLSVDATIGELSAPSPALPLAMRTAPQVVFNAPVQVWQGAGRWNVTISWQPIAKPWYSTNYVGQLTLPSGTPIAFSGTNTSRLFTNLALGNYSVAVHGDNWCGAGLTASQLFTLRGLGNPTNPRIIQ